MGAKKFTNETDRVLFIQLTVRESETPGETHSVFGFRIGSKQVKTVEYSGDDHPFLDAIAVSSADTNGVVATQQSVGVRGGEIDNSFNSKNSIGISEQGNSLTLAFSNS